MCKFKKLPEQRREIKNLIVAPLSILFLQSSQLRKLHNSWCLISSSLRFQSKKRFCFFFTFSSHVHSLYLFFALVCISPSVGDERTWHSLSFFVLTLHDCIVQGCVVESRSLLNSKVEHEFSREKRIEIILRQAKNDINYLQKLILVGEWNTNFSIENRSCNENVLIAE